MPHVDTPTSQDVNDCHFTAYACTSWSGVCKGDEGGLMNPLNASAQKKEYAITTHPTKYSYMDTISYRGRSVFWDIPPPPQSSPFPKV